MTTKASPLDHLRSRKKPVHRRVPMYLDSDVVAEVDQARGEVAALKKEQKESRNPTAFDGAIREAQAEVEAKLELLEEHTAWFVVRAIAPDDYDALIDKYPPTKQQKQDARRDGRQLPWNPDTFPPVLIAATTCLATVPDPEDLDENGKPVELLTPLDKEFVEDMKTSGQWNAGEIMTFFQAALDANNAFRSRTAVEGLGNG